ncbi:hypothetical protein MUN81_10420 [Hymenobacter sp. 5317J-9]|uniref:hypothetical protein n=1 Tax=Hymenobacter sp. 5317J-9 TaxID=2932250 RepID=UPI001FD6A8D2|nr:hypothetical protein [Hymenobacter sp. 5317J-9]UOQ99893.1 hypothetical protein MUN81_10420 [Hymenobacter sp. 5317J-9]
MPNKTPLTPEQEIAELKRQLAESNAEKEAQASIISTQEEQLAAAAVQGAGALSVVTHDKKRYQVLAGRFSLKGVSITHQELKSKPELVQQLVEENSPLLELIEEPAKAA